MMLAVMDRAASSIALERVNIKSPTQESEDTDMNVMADSTAAVFKNPGSRTLNPPSI